MECEADEHRSFKALVSSSLQIEQMSLPNGKHIKWNGCSTHMKNLDFI